MTTREADKAIKYGKPITVRSYAEVFEVTVIGRDRRTLSTLSANGHKGAFMRDEVEILLPTATTNKEA